MKTLSPMMVRPRLHVCVYTTNYTTLSPSVPRSQGLILAPYSLHSTLSLWPCRAEKRRADLRGEKTMMERRCQRDAAVVAALFQERTDINQCRGWRKEASQIPPHHSYLTI